MKPAWLAQPERGSVLLLRLMVWIALRLGRQVGRALLYPICGYFLLFSRATRRASRDFLGRVLGRPVHWWDLFCHYHTFAGFSTRKRPPSMMKFSGFGAKVRFSRWSGAA